MAAIDPNWACPWPLNWQRHHRILTDIATTEPNGVLPHIQPGVHFQGDDLGKWLERQARDWAQLSQEQQRRLSALGLCCRICGVGLSWSGMILLAVVLPSPAAG